MLAIPRSHNFSFVLFERTHDDYAHKAFSSIQLLSFQFTVQLCCFVFCSYDHILIGICIRYYSAHSSGFCIRFIETIYTIQLILCNLSDCDCELWCLICFRLVWICCEDVDRQWISNTIKKIWPRSSSFMCFALNFWFDFGFISVFWYVKVAIATRSNRWKKRRIENNLKNQRTCRNPFHDISIFRSHSC